MTWESTGFGCYCAITLGKTKPRATAIAAKAMKATAAISSAILIASLLSRWEYSLYVMRKAPSAAAKQNGTPAMTTRRISAYPSIRAAEDNKKASTTFVIYIVEAISSAKGAVRYVKTSQASFIALLFSIYQLKPWSSISNQRLCHNG